MPYLRSGYSSSLRCAALVSAGLLALAGAAFGATPKPGPGSAAAKAKTVGRTLPLVFEENTGQLPAGTAFAGRTQQYSVQILPSELRFQLAGKRADRTVSLSFTGSSNAKPEGVSDANVRTNVYLGNDPRKWYSGIRNFDRVALRQLYPGVDAEFYAQGEEIEHDFMVAPGADASQLAMHLAGSASVSVSPAGDLLLAGEEGQLRLHKPVAYQIATDGSHQPVPAEFELTKQSDSADVRFHLGSYDHSRKLVIDPVISYATYVMGNKSTTPIAIAADNAGNVYLTGVTSAGVSSWAATSSTVLPSGITDPPAVAVGFVAKLAAVDSGSKIAWVTYYGSTTNNVTPESVYTLPSGATNVYIAGISVASDLPGTAGSYEAAAGTGTTFGFVAAFNTADGTAGNGGTKYATYVAPNSAAGDNTSLNTVTVDSTGNVTVAGNTTGTSGATFNPTPVTLTGIAGPLLPFVPSSFCSSTGNTGTYAKGLLLTLDATLTTQVYGSLICGDTNGTASGGGAGEYVVDGVVVVPGASAAAIPTTYYISGYSNLDFPQSGVYGLPDLTLTPPTFFTPVGAKTSAFAASLAPNTLTVNYSYWSGGSGNDSASGLAVGTGGEVFVYGLATSPNLLTSQATSPASSGGVTGYNQNYPTGNTQDGFVVELTNGNINATTYLGGSGSSTSTAYSGAVDASNHFYVTGRTNDVKANFPQIQAGASTGNRPATVSTLPSGEPGGLDSVQNTYLLRMPDGLASVDYLAYLGPTTFPTATSSFGSGVALDAATLPDSTPSPNAYVFSFDQYKGSNIFTTAAAAQQLPLVPTNAVTSYVAQIAFTAPGAGPAISYTPATTPYSPNPVGYVSSTNFSTITLNWPVTTGASGANHVVFNLPQSTFLQAYTASSLMVTVGGVADTTDCKLGATTVANTNPGFTCVFPQVAANTVIQFTLTDGVSSSVPSGGTFTVVASAFDDQSDSLDLSQSIASAGVPAFTFTNSVSPGTVNAALSTTDSTTPTTQVTYTYILHNTSGNDSPNTTLTTNLDTTKLSVLSRVSSSGCDPTTATSGCDVPAGGTLTYTVTGVYLASQFGSSTTGPYVITTSAPTMSFTPVTSSSTLTGTTDTVNVNGNATITQAQITVTTTPTYNGGFRLGDTGVTIKATLTNSGPNQAGAYTATVTLPQGFTATSSAVVSGTGAANCTASPYTSCTFSNIPGNNGTASFSITGKFNDTGTSSDAVAPPNTNATPTSTTVTGSNPTNSVNTSLQATSAGASSGTYVNAAPASSNASIKVTRVNTLSYGVTLTAPLGSNTVNELSPIHGSLATPNDTLNYSVTVSNSGASIARGVYVAIPLPQPATASALVVTGITVTNPVGAPAADLLSCAYSSTLGAVICYTGDLVTTPTTAATVTLPQSYTVMFSATYSEATIPLTATNGKLPLTQTPGTIFADADGYTVAGGVAGTLNGASANATLNLQRLTNVGQSLTFAAALGQAAPASFADQTHINLDEHVTANAEGKNDSLLVTVTASNTGPDDAAGVAVTIPLPAYMEVAVPTYCKLTGVTSPVTGTMYPTGAAGGTMTCTPPSSTTAAGTSTGQLAASTAACAVTAPVNTTTYTNAAFDGKCMAVSFLAKFVDAPSAATVTGSTPTGTPAYIKATLVENDVDASPTANLTVAPAVAVVQRAAHVRLISGTPIPAPTYTDGTALPVDAGSSLPEIAQAALRMSPSTRLATTGKVYNCIRYSVSVVNDGPNYANSALLNYLFSLGGYASTQVSVGTPASSPAPLDCAGLSPSAIDAAASAAIPAATGPLAPATTGTPMYLDGFFDVGALGAANSGPVVLSTAPFTHTDYNDSNVPASTTDYVGSRSTTVVNTPFNDSTTTGFGVTAYTSSPTAPTVNLIFTSVSQPGITSAVGTTSLSGCGSVSGSANVSGCMPYGKSPYPPDNGAIRNLYQAGKAPQYYQLPTTATVTTGTNPTSVCITANTASHTLPDIFVKPERALLWVLANASTGTTPNPFPTGYPTLTSTLAGDVTTASIPYLPSATSPSYLKVPAAITFPQVPQAQPAMVCGTVNGLVNTNTAASAETFGLLEPVNFPPYVAAGSVQTSATTSKGSTAALSDVYVQFAFDSTGKPTAGFTYDYNDRDPCYVAGARTTCDDNPYLAVFAFADDSSNNPEHVGPFLLPLAGGTYFTGNANLEASPTNSYRLYSNLNLTTTTAAFVAVADQATGADGHNLAIASAAGYTSNPFYRQGNFLAADYLAGTTPTLTVCDPGSASTYTYTPGPNPCTGGLTASPTIRYIRGGQKDSTVALNYSAVPDLAGNYFYLGNVGAQAVVASGLGGTGLIPLPFPDLTTPPTGANPQNPGGSTSTPLGSDPSTKATTAAIGTVTPGQSVGFIWSWLQNETTASGVAGGAAAGDKYDLACFMVDSATQQQKIAFPQGLSCNIGTTTPSVTNASAVVYTFGSSTAPTIFVTSTGSVFARVEEPGAWKRAGEGIALAMLLPVFFFRRRLGKGATLALLLLTLAAAPLLSGCGSGGSLPGSSTSVTPSGNYLFRVTATPETSGKATITSAVFEVVVGNAN